MCIASSQFCVCVCVYSHSWPLCSGTAITYTIFLPLAETINTKGFVSIWFNKWNWHLILQTYQHNYMQHWVLGIIMPAVYNYTIHQSVGVLQAKTRSPCVHKSPLSECVVGWLNACFQKRLCGGICCYPHLYNSSLQWHPDGINLVAGVCQIIRGR